MADREQNSSEKPYHVEITPEGSLGLLALGATGIKAWKEKRKEVASDKKQKEDGTTDR